MNKSKTILIIEDEKSLRGAMEDILLLKNFVTISAKNGKEGVDLAHSRHPDLILLDLIMPEMDGMTALKNIRLSAWGQKVPIIILTNLSATNDHPTEDFSEYGQTHYLIKSDCKLHDIVGRIEDLLKS